MTQRQVVRQSCHCFPSQTLPPWRTSVSLKSWATEILYVAHCTKIRQIVSMVLAELPMTAQPVPSISFEVKFKVKRKLAHRDLILTERAAITTSSMARARHSTWRKPALRHPSSRPQGGISAGGRWRFLTLLRFVRNDKFQLPSSAPGLASERIFEQSCRQRPKARRVISLDPLAGQVSRTTSARFPPSGWDWRGSRTQRAGAGSP